MLHITEANIVKKVLISLPEELVRKMNTAIPSRQRSKTICRLIEEEIKRLDQELYEAAKAADAAEAATGYEEQKAWDCTINDGLEDETW